MTDVNLLCALGTAVLLATTISLGLAACPEGFFGPSCQGQCHCLNPSNCDSSTGHCRGGECDLGYTGAPQCQKFCPVGMFGFECSLRCHCLGNGDCHKVTGECKNQQCHEEWGGEACQRGLPKILIPPIVVSAECMNITLSWTAHDESRDKGEGPIAFYSVYFKQNAIDDSSYWELGGMVQDQQDDRRTYELRISKGLRVNAWYIFRVDAHGLDGDRALKRVLPGITTRKAVENTCEGC
ncbi:hypothetical protein Btru_040252 [Bulinus truncatus]|nr:hypothetical protein Btru_040252 [Bulinus truncatus]